jgi:hypothetical protein
LDYSNKIDFGLEIWRSQVNPSFKVEKYLIITVILLTLIIPIIIIIFTLSIIGLEVSFLLLLITETIILLMMSPLILLGIRYFLSFIVIYEKGVAVRESNIIKLWKKRFIAFKEIKGFEIGSKSAWTQFGEKIYRPKLIILIKKKQPYQISNSWVNDVSYVKDLLIYYYNNCIS